MALNHRYTVFSSRSLLPLPFLAVPTTPSFPSIFAGVDLLAAQVDQLKHNSKRVEKGPKEKMVMEIIKEVLTILMQLVWKVVRPQDLKVGDHIYRYGLGGSYNHHGIYVGDGYVIHFTRTQCLKTLFPLLSITSCKQEDLPPCTKCEYQETIHRGVVKNCLDCFRRDGKKLRPLHCHEYGWPVLGFKLARRGTCTTLLDPELPQQVINKAHKLHANNAFGNYSLINNNCEHFATFCRIDVCASEQTTFISDCERKIKEAKEWTRKLLQRK